MIAAGNRGTPRSQRDCATKPRVARHELPWVSPVKGSQPQRGCGNLRPTRHNPFGVVLNSPRIPRVARFSQPWALLRNPFGIHLFTAAFLLVLSLPVLAHEPADDISLLANEVAN